MLSARGGALTALVFVCGLSGCATARQVAITPDGGCVAIAENSDVWPYKYHTKALELIKQNCPNGYEIVREEPAVYVGRHGQVREGSEWRIYYRKLGVPASRPALVMVPPVPPVPPVSQPMAPQPVVPVSASGPPGLPPVPVPVSNR